ncbi:MAG: TIR domain-containing protein [Chloroflexi bacterium]|nr:TIR domain-containing protein [Chloroflexota bacterium]
MAEVFISYSRKDTDFVRRLHTALAALNRDTWVDWEDIPLTADWWREVQGGIEAANAFVFVISPDSIRSDICRQEIEHAVANNKRIIPLLRREVTDPADRKAMHPAISTHNWIFFREGDNFDTAFQALINALNTDLSYVRQHTRLLVRAREWENNGNNPSFLLGGDNLRDAEHWLAEAVGKEPQPLPVHAEYITASRTAERRRQRALLAGVSVALVVSLALAVMALLLYGEANNQRAIADQAAATAISAQNEALNQAGIAQTQAAIAATAQTDAEAQRNIALAQATTVARERDRAQSIGLSAYAQVEQSGPQPERGVLLALEALQNFAYTWQAERALALAVQGEFNHQTLDRHRMAVYSAVWSPDSARLVTASADGTARVWTADGEVQHTLQHGDVVNRALWSPDGTRITTASADRTAAIWDANTGDLVVRLSGHQGNVYVAVWSPDGRLIATSSADRTARIWDAISGSLLHTLTGHNGSVNSVVWSPDGKRLVTASDDTTSIIWDAASGQRVLTLIGHTRNVNRAAWSPDGRAIATASADRTARIWDAASGQSLVLLSAHLGSVTRVAWSPDSRRLVTTSTDDTARIWNARSGELLFTLFGHTDDVLGVTWSPGGRRIVTTSRDMTARLWDADSGAQMTVFTGHADMVYSVDWSQSGELLATASEDSTARIWQTWTTAQKLISFARRCCVERLLTDEERQQFGLPRPTSVPPPAQIASCPNTLPSRLYPNTRGQVTDEDETALRVRSGPGLGNPIIAQIPPRQTFWVLDGPQCADGYAWFRVIFGINAVQGWVAEGGDGKYFTEPVG